jgi:hypothetical protein
MKFRNLILICALVFGLGASAATVAHAVDPFRHPNLAAAQEFIDKAIGSVNAAQRANEFDLDGHAIKARELLMEANREIKLAARASNRNHR